MKWFLGFIALAGMGLLLASCSSTTTLPTGGVPSGATSISLYTPEIQASIAMQQGFTQTSQVILTTDTQLVNYAAVTLTGPSALSLPLTFASSYTAGSDYVAYYQSNTGWGYQANQTYTMTISYDSHTYQGSVKSAGNVVFTPGSSALTITWDGGGNYNTLIALQTDGSGTYSLTTNFSSPHSLANSNLPGYTGGNYNVEMNAEELKTGAFSGGAYLASYFSAADQETDTGY
jgi:hypothetical protein